MLATRFAERSGVAHDVRLVMHSLSMSANSGRCHRCRSSQCQHRRTVVGRYRAGLATCNVDRRVGNRRPSWPLYRRYVERACAATGDETRSRRRDPHLHADLVRVRAVIPVTLVLVELAFSRSDSTVGSSLRIVLVSHAYDGQTIIDQSIVGPRGSSHEHVSAAVVPQVPSGRSPSPRCRNRRGRPFEAARLALCAPRAPR